MSRNPTRAHCIALLTRSSSCQFTRPADWATVAEAPIGPRSLRSDDIIEKITKRRGRRALNGGRKPTTSDDRNQGLAKSRERKEGSEGHELAIDATLTAKGKSQVPFARLAATVGRRGCDCFDSTSCLDAFWRSDRRAGRCLKARTKARIIYGRFGDGRDG